MKNEENKISRRTVIGGLGVGMAAMAASSVLGATSSGSSNHSVSSGLEDPTTKYPKPPFKEQKQPWLGLASRMDTQPDHGETSYKGSGRLIGRKALITG